MIVIKTNIFVNSRIPKRCDKRMTWHKKNEHGIDQKRYHRWLNNLWTLNLTKIRTESRELSSGRLIVWDKFSASVTARRVTVEVVRVEVFETLSSFGAPVSSKDSWPSYQLNNSTFNTSIFWIADWFILREFPQFTDFQLGIFSHWSRTVAQE